MFARPQPQPQADAGPALPWQNQDAPAAPQPQAYPDPSQGYYQHDPYAQQQHPQHGYYAQDPYAQPQGGDAYYGHYFQPGQQQPPQASPPPATGYYQGQQQHPGAYPQPGQAYVDPRTGYDLGNYTTQPPQRTQPPTHGHGYAAAPPPPPQGYDPNAYPHQQSGHDAEHEHDDYHEYEDEEVEEPKSRFRSLFVVASLIGAIALGAGLAYGYKKFGGGQGVGNPPVVKASAGQSKVRADGADGKKVAERLDGPAPAVVPARVAEAPQPAGPRVVQTIPVAPNGTLISPPPQAAAPTPLRPTISVPGMAIDNLPPSGPPPQAIAAVAPAPPQPQPQAPQIISAPAGRPVAPPPPAAVAPVERAPVQKTAKAAAAVAAPATTAATPAPRASNGYVAVLSSQGSRIDALKAYADLQQKYNSVLGGKPADVQEATVNGKVWYRAVVGPPGSRNAAADLCAQLKTAGHSACFPAAY